MLKFLRGALDAYHDNRDAKWKRMMKREALSCNNCNNSSVPVYGSRNKYECLGCGRRFTNTAHNIANRISNTSSKFHEKNYNVLIAELKKEM